MTFAKGKSGNPSGRPKKDRALTALLEAAGGRVVETDAGRMARRRVAIENIWQAVTEGRVRFLDGSELSLYSKDYVELVKFLFTHIDGPPPAKLEHSSDPERPLTIRVEYDDPLPLARVGPALAATTLGAVADSE